MSEVKRYTFEMIESREGNLIDAEDFDRVTAERDAALGREVALREEMAALKHPMNSAVQVRAERDALQQLLNAADERRVLLETALRKIKMRLDAYAESDMRMPEPSVEVCQAIADAALNSAEGVGDDK